MGPRRPNSLLRRQRKLRGWSQEDVATGLHRLAASIDEPEPGVDACMVSRWERGTRRPRSRYVRLLCALFELPAEQLGTVDVADEPRPHIEHTRLTLEDDDVQRRDFMNGIARLLGVAALSPTFVPQGPEPWERLASALRQPGPVDVETVAHLERVTIALESLAPTQFSSVALFGPVSGHLDAITFLLRGSAPAHLRSRLCSLAGETAGFAGRLRREMDDHDGATAYFSAALQAAREADDRPLVAYLLGIAACQPPHRERPDRRIRRLRTLNRDDATPAARTWLAAKEADALAMRGRTDDCLQALDRAERALEDARAEDPGARRPRFTEVDRYWLDGERGASLAKLGRNAQARAILRPVVAALGPTSERDRLWLLTSLASTYLQDGEPEEACHLAGIAFSRAATMHLTPVMKLVQGLRQDMQPFSAIRAVRELDDHLRSTACHPVFARPNTLAG